MPMADGPKDYYEELGVQPDATDEEIRAAYRRKAKGAHPDRPGGDAGKMAQANRAYETLISPDRRLTYDRTGEDRPPPIDRRAQDLVTSNVLAWMGSDDTSGDLVADVTKHFAQQQKDLLKKVVEGTAFAAKLRKRVSKLKYRGKGADLVRFAVIQKIRETKQLIEKLKDQADVFDRAKELLRTYEYEVEVPPSQSLSIADLLGGRRP